MKSLGHHSTTMDILRWFARLTECEIKLSVFRSLNQGGSTLQLDNDSKQSFQNFFKGVAFDLN